METTDELTPPEAMVLMDTAVRPAQLFKVTVMALMLRGMARAVTDERRGWFRTRRVTRLHAGLAPGQPGHVQAALEVVRSVNGGTVADVVAAARTAYGPDLGRFKQEQVIPALIRRELVQQGASRVLWVFPRRLLRTPSGTAALGQLLAALDRGRTVPAFLDSDPRQAAMIAASLGTLILLVEELRPHLKQLAQILRERDGVASGDGGDGGGSGASDHHDLNPGWDAGAFDAFGGAMDGFNAGFDSAFDGGGSDGGGDSGGGDGGGGGGE